MKDISDTLRTTFRRALRLENRRGSVRAGRLQLIPGFASSILGNSRDVVVYLPPGYDERSEQRYPVLYMHDGQNLFDPQRAFGGQHWRLQEAADKAIGGRTAEAMIIVAVDHAGVGRADEYTPTFDPDKKAGGKAAEHARMLVEELKPVIDAGFRTRPEPASTAIGGSSLGGLDSLYLALHHSDVFGGAAVMSPSVWWNGRAILKHVDEWSAPNRPRIWLDIGGREGAEALGDARLLRNRLMAQGWGGDHFEYYEEKKADHSERAWAARAQKPLEFLFPPR
jgi:predicted alpha/beta superfamily hydrolase